MIVFFAAAAAEAQMEEAYDYLESHRQVWVTIWPSRLKKPSDRFPSTRSAGPKRRGASDAIVLVDSSTS
jgi:hypothetical protein